MARARPRAALVAAAALVALSAADLLSGSRALLPTVPVSLLHEPPPEVAFIGTGRFLAGPGVAADVHAEDASLTGNEERDDFLRIVRHDRATLLAGLAGLYGKNDASIYGPFAPSRLAALVFVTLKDADEEAANALADLAAIDSVLVRPGSALARLWPTEPVPGTRLRIARPRPGPLARLATRAIRARAETSAAALAVRFGRLESDAVYEGSHEPLSQEGPPGKIVSLDRDADRVLVVTRAEGERLLVLSDLFLEGTTATIDGERAEVVPADLALTGIFVPAGEHRVRVEWHVPGLAPGAAVSLASLLAAIALALGRGRSGD